MVPASDMPNAMSTAGTAAAPTTRKGSIARSGSAVPVAPSAMPAAAASTRGFRSTTPITRPGDVEPWDTRSASTKNIGVKRPSWKSRTGTTCVADPST